MATYTIVAKDKDPLGPNEINAGTNIQVQDGDVFIIDATADASVTFEADGGTPASFDVQINDTNTNAFDLVFKADLTPTITIADNVDASDIKISAGDTDTTTFLAGDNVSFGSYTGAVTGVDNITIGNGFTATDTWNLQGGNDVIDIGDDATFGDFKAGDGDDTIILGANASFTVLDGENGTDTLNTQTTGLGEQNIETTNVVCYAAGTLIETPDGPRAVETLRPGDSVLTLDNGPKEILWSHRHDQPLDDVDRDARPILIAAGSLGKGIPDRDLIVSPQHRILVGGHGQLQDRLDSEAFAPAKSLSSLPGIRPMMGKRHMTWYHFACKRHEVVFANGCLSESVLLGRMVLNGLADMELQALNDIFGPHHRQDRAMNGPLARECLSVGEVQRKLKKSRTVGHCRQVREIWESGLPLQRNKVKRSVCGG